MHDEPIRPGYKRTEVGVIPEDWEVGELGDLEPFVTSGSRGWAVHYSDQGDVFLRITNLTRESIYLNLADLKLVKLPPDDKEGTRTSLQNGDLLISITADIGIIGYIDSSVPKPAYINQHIALVRLGKTKVDTKFLSYYLAGENSQRLFRAMVDQGAKAGMSLIGIRKIRSVFPPLPEQHAIAEVLSDVDALLDALERLIAKKRAIKQGAMQALLTGRVRLPGFRDEWNRTTLGEIALITMGQSPDSRNYNVEGRGIPLVQGNADIKNRRSIRRVWTTQITKACDKGDLLLTVRAPVGIVGRASEYSCLGRGVCALKPNGVDGDFLYHVLIFAESQWEIVEQGSTFTSANSTQISAFTLAIPISLEEQTAIAEVLSDMDAEIEALERRRAKVRAIKQGMMQELLTGRVRLVPPQTQPQEADA